MLTAKVPSGIDALDDVWEGLFRGSGYLLYGRAQTGRDLLTLQMARVAVEAYEPVVLVSPRTPRDLARQADTIGFDLEAACRRGRLRLLRVPPPLVQGDDDEAIDAALRDLARIAGEQRSARLIIEDFTPFVRFRQFARLRESIVRFLEAVAKSDTTTILGLGEPASAQSAEIVAFLRGQLAGSIHLAADTQSPAPTARRLTLQPRLGSLQVDQQVAWDLIRLREPLSSKPEKGGINNSQDDGTASRAPEYPVNGDGRPGADADQSIIELSIPTAPVTENREIEPVPESGTGRTEVRSDAPIRFFAPTDPYGPAPEVEDPFAAVGIRGSFLERGHYLEGRFDEPAAETESASNTGPLSGESHHTEESPRAKELSSANGPLAVPLRREISDAGPKGATVAPVFPPDQHSDFEAAFNAALTRHQTNDEPFLAIALRAGPTPEGALHFPAVVDALRRSLREEDVLFGDLSRGRAAVLLPGRNKSAAQPLFSEVKGQLRAAEQAAAEHSMRSLSAAVVPDGRPFTAGQAFLRFVLDSE